MSIRGGFSKVYPKTTYYNFLLDRAFTSCISTFDPHLHPGKYTIFLMNFYKDYTIVYYAKVGHDTIS